MKSELTAGGGKQVTALYKNQRRAKVYESFSSEVPGPASLAHFEMIERVLWAALAETARFRDLKRRLELEG